MDYNYSIEHGTSSLVTFLNENHIQQENIIWLFKDEDDWYTVIYKV